MNKPTGDFGKVVKNYKAIRPGYPNKIITDIYSFVKNPKPVVLDLGCGTGIATVQLAKKDANVFGCDIDETMLAHAQKKKNITYSKGSAEKLPFAKESFDLVTMFTSFHWFTTAKALKEIKRVLKPGGVTCIVQPQHTAPFINDHQEIISKALETNVKLRYSQRRFEEVLTRNNFTIIGNKVYKTVDTYTLQQFLKLIQTYSIWNEVPPKKREYVLKLLKEHFSTLLKRGCIYDTVDINLICAQRLKIK